jgi:hypothetical protein
VPVNAIGPYAVNCLHRVHLLIRRRAPGMRHPAGGGAASQPLLRALRAPELRKARRQLLEGHTRR